MGFTDVFQSKICLIFKPDFDTSECIGSQPVRVDIFRGGTVLTAARELHRHFVSTKN